MPAVLLGSCIPLCSETGGILNARGLEFSRRAEVNKGNISVRLEHDVCGLHIPVDDRRLAGVQVTKHVAQLLRPLDNILLTLGAACFERLVQGVALYVIHDDEKASVAVDNVDNTG